MHQPSLKSLSYAMFSILLLKFKTFQVDTFNLVIILKHLHAQMKVTGAYKKACNMTTECHDGEWSRFHFMCLVICLTIF